MPSSRRRSGVIILALFLALAGCGSGDAKGPGEADGSGAAKPAAPQGSDPVAWVGAFCSSSSGVVAGAAALGKAEETPQGQKDGLLAFADSSQRAMADTARRLEQLGAPRITDGQRLHDTAVKFFRSAAESVAGQRAKLAELDPNDPEYVQKLSRLAGPDLGALSAQLQQMTANPELAPAFNVSPECQQLRTGGGRR
ncbi:MAG: hypothetical protein M3228_13550 [Actinomycetota bacterium]|nr:hypothetical protein [Actinomycetota bacterium]